MNEILPRPLFALMASYLDGPSLATLEASSEEKSLVSRVHELHYRDFLKASVTSPESLYGRLARAVEADPTERTASEKGREIIAQASRTLKWRRFLLKPFEEDMIAFSRRIPFEEMTFEEQERMDKILLKKKAEVLLAFFDEIAKCLPEARRFREGLAADLSPVQKADLTRVWLKENAPLLRSRIDDLSAFNPINYCTQKNHLPPEAALLFHLDEYGTDWCLGKSMTQGQFETAVALFPRCRFDEKRCALWGATDYGEIELIKTFLELEPALCSDLLAMPWALIRATAHGRLDVVRFTLEKIRGKKFPNLAVPPHKEALLISTSRGHLEVVLALLEHCDFLPQEIEEAIQAARQQKHGEVAAAIESYRENRKR